MNIIFNIINGLLNSLFNTTGDYGISIILLTIIVKLILMPMSIKQKNSFNKQQDIGNKLNEIKEIYKNNDEKIKEESQKVYMDSTKGMLGCLVTLIQLPIIYTLYRVIIKIPVAKGTMLIPWVTNIKLPDNYFILPIIYVLVTMIPLLLPYLPIIKSTYKAKMTLSNIITMAVFSIFIIIKAPIAIGIYFITSGLYTSIEEFVFRLYLKNKSVMG